MSLPAAGTVLGDWDDITTSWDVFDRIVPPGSDAAYERRTRFLQPTAGGNGSKNNEQEEDGGACVRPPVPPPLSSSSSSSSSSSGVVNNNGATSWDTFDSIPVPESAVPKKQPAVEEARREQRQERLAAAVEQAARCASRHAAHAQRHANAGRLRTALMWFTMAIGAEPTSAAHLCARARCHLGLRRWRCALGDSVAALSVDASTVAAYAAAARAYLELGQVRRARETVRLGLSRDESCAELSAVLLECKRRREVEAGQEQEQEDEEEEEEDGPPSSESEPTAADGNDEEEEWRLLRDTYDALFDTFDANKDGFVDAAELTRGMMLVGACCEPRDAILMRERLFMNPAVFPLFGGILSLKQREGGGTGGPGGGDGTSMQQYIAWPDGSGVPPALDREAFRLVFAAVDFDGRHGALRNVQRHAEQLATVRPRLNAMFKKVGGGADGVSAVLRQIMCLDGSEPFFEERDFASGKPADKIVRGFVEHGPLSEEAFAVHMGMFLAYFPEVRAPWGVFEAVVEAILQA